MWAAAASALLALLAACGGGTTSGGGTTPPPAQGSSAPVSITIGDAPPPGITVISFEVTLTGATLNPPGGSGVSLVTSPIQIELKRLETETAFLSTVNVPAGTYNSITLSFANVELTIKNDTGAAFSFAGVNCASGAVCEFKPGAPGSVTYSGSPFPLTIQANAGTGLLVDVNLQNILSTPLGVNLQAANGVTVLQLPTPGMPTGQLDDIEDLCGVVQSKDTANNQFTLQTSRGLLTIRVDSNTQFEGFDDISLPNTFASLAAGQIVEADLRLLALGTLFAAKVELEDQNANEQEVEGVIVGVTSATQFQMVVMHECPDVAGLETGNVATVTLQQGARFRVAQDGMMIPSGLRNAFEGASDTSELLAGQQVHVRRRPGSSGTSINTDRVTLKRSRLSASVLSVIPPNFTVNGLSSLFTSAGINQIQVQTIQQTAFQGVSGAASLQTGDNVSLRGLLFRSVPDPILIAKKVRKR
jgi:hypothetical protein